MITISDKTTSTSEVVETLLCEIKRKRNDVILDDIPWLHRSLLEMVENVGTRLEKDGRPLMESVMHAGIETYLCYLRADTAEKLPDYQRIFAFYSGASSELEILLPFEFVSITDGQLCKRWHYGCQYSFDEVFEGVSAAEIMMYVTALNVQKLTAHRNEIFLRKAKLMADIDACLKGWFQLIENRVSWREGVPIIA